jgi:outer membrane protein assembly factor BamB
MLRVYRFSLVMLLVSSSAAFADNWPQWRGPKNDGHSTEKNLPTEWSETKNVVWKAKLPGPGASVPCIWEDKIFITCQVGDDLLLMCFNTKGQEQWSRKMGSGKSTYRGDEGNMASASCSTDGKHVYAFVGSGQIGAYTFAGSPAWELDLAKKYGAFKIQFGAHWTPVLYKDFIYVTLFHRGTQSIVAIKKAGGDEAWKVDRTSDGKGESPDVYSSPFIWEKNDEEALLIAHGNDYCTAHKLEDGSEVWRVNELNPKAKYNMAWRAVSSPLVTPNLIVIPSCKNGVTVAIDPNKAKGLVQPGSSAEVWRLTKGTPDVPSPVLVGNHVYILRETTELAVYDARSGAQYYAEKVTNERHRANPVYADGKIYIVGRDGTMPVVKAGDKFDLLAKNKLPDTFTASPAISGGKIYLRGWNYLWAIGTK